MQDFKEILQKYMGTIEARNDIDPMDTVEKINPNITSDSKKYKEGNKYIFKQFIGYENSEDILNAVINTQDYNVYNLNEYKDNIYQKMIYTFEQAENPVEILVYSTRGLDSDIYRNAILDVLRDIVLDYKQDVIEAYRNILSNWTWQDCNELVLKSIEQNLLLDLSDIVYNIFTNSYALRESAASTLIGIDAENKFKSMINFLVVKTGDSTADITTLRSIMYNLGKNSTKGSKYIYEVYVTTSCRNQISNALILGMKMNMIKEIYDDIEGNLFNSQLDRRTCAKIITLLERSKEYNSVSEKILERYLKNNEDTEVITDDINRLIEIATDDSAYERRRIKAIMKISRNKDTRVTDAKIKEVLRSLYDKSDMLRIAVVSALVEKGEKKELLVLFKYLVGTSRDSEECIEATNQIRRLIANSNEEIKESITKVIAKFMENNEAKNTETTLRVLDLYFKGRPSEEIGLIFLKKLKESKYIQIKSKILNFFSTNYEVFPDYLKEEIREEIVNCSRITEISKEAMESLKLITATITTTPDL